MVGALDSLGVALGELDGVRVASRIRVGVGVKVSVGNTRRVGNPATVGVAAINGVGKNSSEVGVAYVPHSDGV